MTVAHTTRGQRRSTERPVRRWSRWSLGLLVGAAAALATLFSWSLASPPASSPDDLFHLPSIWCAHGENDRCIRVPGEPDLRAVPPYASASATCFAGKTVDSAICQDKLLNHHEPDVATDGNWGGDYPPVYYWVMGWLVSDRAQLSILLMRFLAGTVVVGLAAWLTAALPREVKHVVAVPLVALSMPLGLFLMGSNNPSGWAIGSAALVWPALHGAFLTRGRRQAQLCVLAVLGALIGAGSRADACVFTAMAVGVAVLLNLRRLRSALAATLVSAGVLVMSAVFFLGSAQSGAALSSGLNAGQIVDEQSSLGWFELTLNNFVNMPLLWGGVLGSGPFGTTGVFDVGFPYTVGFLVVAAVVVLAFASWKRPDRTHALPLAAVVVGLFVYPLYILAKTKLIVGAGIQPRYLLPVLIMVLGLVLLSGGRRLARGTAFGIAAALTLSHALALHVQMRRYISGQDESALSLESHREWWWNLPFPPTLVWVVGCLGFGVTAFLVVRMLVPTDPTAEDVTTRHVTTTEVAT